MALRKRPMAAGVAALFFSSCLFSSWIAALGLGKVELHSALNEPLDAVIRLDHTAELGEAEIIAGLASAQDFAAAGIDRELILSDLAFKLDFSDPANPLLRITSHKPIREPYLDFLVDVQWPTGRVLREFTLLLDLPVVAANDAARATTSAGVPASAERERAAAAPSPVPAAPVGHRGDRPSAAGTPVVPGRDYPVGTGDTLWNIAARLPGDEPVRLKMAAIQQLNPTAFIDGDSGRLRHGHVLRIPAMGANSSRPAGEPGSAPGLADTPAPEPPQGTGGHALSAVRGNAVSEQANAASEADLVPGVAAPGSGVSREEWRRIRDELARTHEENTELKGRLGKLEEQLAGLRELMALDDRSPAIPVAAVEVADTASGGGEEAPGAVVAMPAAAPPTVAVEAGRDWPAAVGSYLVFIFGLLVVLIGALVIAALRRRERLADRYDQDNDYLPVQGRSGGPDMPERERAPPASSLDDIDLHEDDDIFARPADTAAEIRSLFVDDDPAAGGVPDSFPAADVTGEAFSPEPPWRQAPAEAPFSDAPVAGRPVPAAQSPAAPVPSADDSEVEDLELDLSELELDDILNDHGAAPATGAAIDAPLDLDDFDFGDADQGDTQLELAEAYLDMGDHGGAREILQEVLAAGSDEQKTRAEALLARLAGFTGEL